MNRPWSALKSFSLDAEHPVRGFFLGQALALAVSVGALAAHLAGGPLLAHSVYVVALPALVVALGLGGAAAGATATLILAGGAWLADAGAGVAAPERLARTALFLLAGLAAAWIAAGLRRAWIAQQGACEAQAEFGSGGVGCAHGRSST